MAQSRPTRTVMLAGGALLLACLCPIAAAQDVPQTAAAPELSDPFIMSPSAGETAINLQVRQDAVPRFAVGAPMEAVVSSGPGRIELELSAGGDGAPLDIAIAQSATVRANSAGQIDQHASGSELRVGRGLVDRNTSNGRSVYAFVASDDEALTWQPGARTEFGNRSSSLALQNQVQVGDLSAGVRYQRNGVQASLAYVEREESTRVGQQTFSQDQSFTGVTVTVRH